MTFEQELRRQLVGVLTPASQPGRFGHDRDNLLAIVERSCRATNAAVALALEGLIAEGLVVLHVAPERNNIGGTDQVVYARLAKAEQTTLF